MKTTRSDIYLGEAIAWQRNNEDLGKTAVYSLPLLPNFTSGDKGIFTCIQTS